MEPSCTKAPTASLRAVRPVSGLVYGVFRSVAASGAGHEGNLPAPDTEAGDPPPPDTPPRSAWRQAPLFFAASGPTTGQVFWLLVFALSAAALYWLSLRQKKLEEGDPDPWSQPRAVEHTLILAMDRQAVFHLEPLPPSPPPEGRGVKIRPLAFMALDGTCAHLGQHTLTVQLDAALSGQELAAWAGKDVRAEFCVSVGDDWRFFRFDSVVLRGMADAACPLLELARPLRLEPHQRRAFPRVSASATDVAALGLWPLEDHPASGSASRRVENTAPEQGPGGRPEADPACPARPSGLPTEPAALPAPLLLFRPGVAATVRLIDISASGLGLRLKKNALPAPLHGCLVFLCLRAPGGAPLLVWLACERRHLTLASARPTATLGLAVRQWSQVPAAEAPIFWNPPASDGSVPPLYRWILRRQAAVRRPRCFNLQH